MTPQLLTCYGDHVITYPLWAERKYDGVRCVIIVQRGAGDAYSREGNRLPAGQAAADEVARLAGDGVYDGELVGASLPVTLSAVKRGDGSGLRYKAFDHLTLDEWSAGGSGRSLAARKAALAALMPRPSDRDRVVDVVPGKWCRDEDELTRVFDHAVSLQWEGVVAKMDAPYQCGKRAKSWMKLKPILREEW